MKTQRIKSKLEQGIRDGKIYEISHFLETENLVKCDIMTSFDIIPTEGNYTIVVNHKDGFGGNFKKTYPLKKGTTIQDFKSFLLDEFKGDMVVEDVE